MVAVFIMLCGCKTIPKDILSDFKNTVGGILREGSGIFVESPVKAKDITELKGAKVQESSIYTMCYSRLSKKQKSFYSILLEAADKMPPKWIYMGKLYDSASSDISVAYKAMLNDNPQIFWMPPSYMIAESGNKICIAFSYHGDDYSNDYTVDKNSLPEMKTALQNRVDEITEKALSYPNEFERELYIHDEICNGTYYDLEGGELIYSAYGTLVNGVCVCEGYSRAMQLLLHNIGIECFLVYGEYDGGAHMWNCVKIDGLWYHLDTTWDDNEEFGAFHTYFNLTDSEITANHIISESFSSKKQYTGESTYNSIIFPCYDNSANYYEHYSAYLTDDTDIAAKVIKNAYANGESKAELKNLTDRDAETVLIEVSKKLYSKPILQGYAATGKSVIAYW